MTLCTYSLASDRTEQSSVTYKCCTCVLDLQLVNQMPGRDSNLRNGRDRFKHHARAVCSHSWWIKRHELSVHACLLLVSSRCRILSPSCVRTSFPWAPALSHAAELLPPSERLKMLSRTTPLRTLSPRSQTSRSPRPRSPFVRVSRPVRRCRPSPQEAPWAATVMRLNRPPPPATMTRTVISSLPLRFNASNTSVVVPLVASILVAPCTFLVASLGRLSSAPTKPSPHSTRASSL